MGGSVKGKKGRNGTKTHGRNKEWCQAYRARNQREHNKKARQARHLARVAKAKGATQRKDLQSKE